MTPPTGTGRSGGRLDRWYLAGGIAVTGAFCLTAGGVLAVVLYAVVALSTGLALVVGLRHYRPASPRAWQLLTGGWWLFALGALWAAVEDWLLNRPAPGTSGADLLWLSAYPLLLAGVIGMLRARIAEFTRACAIDAVVVAVCLAVLGWIYAVSPLHSSDDAPDVVAEVLALAYPVLDVLVLVPLLRLASTSAAPAPALRLLIGSTVLLLLGDSLFVQRLSEDSLIPRTVPALWLLAHVCAGAAALHPSMRGLTLPAQPAPAAVAGWQRYALPLAPLLPPMLLLAGAMQQDVGAVVPLTLAAAALAFLVAARTAWVHRILADRSGRALQQRTEERFNALFRHTADLILIVDDQGRVTVETPSAARRLGLEPTELSGRTLADLLDDADLRALGMRPPGVLPSPTPALPEAPTPSHQRLHQVGGAAVTVEAFVNDLRAEPAVAGVVVTLRDVGERAAFESELTRLAYTDPLTGLANRQRLLERLRDQSVGADATGGVLLLDLDDFKLVNDLYGHGTGDLLLVEAARRLDLVAADFDGGLAVRLGGDEFALLLPDVEARELRWVCSSLLSRLRQPLRIAGVDIELGTSIGLATFADERPDASTLLRRADLAMYAAKNQGRNRWAAFEPAMLDGLVEQTTLEAELGAALDGNQLRVLYQPILRLDSGRVVGVEALVRWQHPRRGLLSPGEFLPAVERGPRIHDLGMIVLVAACNQLATWIADLGPAAPDHVAVNVHPRQLVHPRFIDDVEHALLRSGLPPYRLVLEVTESSAMDSDRAVHVLARLRDLGVRLAIDDFGTGYSSLSRLKDLPVHTLKIDRSFVQDMDAAGSPLVDAIIAMSRSLGLSLVAEGIETTAQLGALQARGVDNGQGYLLGRPVEPHVLTSRMAAARDGEEACTARPVLEASSR